MHAPLCHPSNLCSSSILARITKGVAKLSSMAAGLAVGKPGDTFSTYSALGRSSVIKGTSAGVIEFSKVGQITAQVV